MSEWKGKRAVILGAARQGVALARYLSQHGARVVLNDQRPADQFISARESLSDLPVAWVCGGHPLGLLDEADLLCVSGGIPLSLLMVVEAMNRGIPLSNDSQIFLETAPCRVIGITGSAGKTTTTTLVGRIAQMTEDNKVGAGTLHTRDSLPSTIYRRIWVGGNIGSPLISVLDQMMPDDLAIMELSSFQLEIMTKSPQIASVLNVTPNHLDRHNTMEAYTAAKTRILEYQSSADTAVLGREDPGAWSLVKKVRGQLVSFGKDKPTDDQAGTYLNADWICFSDGQSVTQLMPQDIIRLRGEHNLLNVLAACAISIATGLPAEAMRSGVDGFSGVPHRLEYVRSWGEADWYNDSIATAPERVMAAINSFEEPLVLLAGGRDKNLPWQDFAHLVCQRIDHLILFGEAADKIEQALQDAAQDNGRDVTKQRPYTTTHCIGLKEAVQAAARIVEAGDVVLLSPGGTSFDEFRDFENRGEAFRQWVQELS